METEPSASLTVTRARAEWLIRFVEIDLDERHPRHYGTLRKEALRVLGPGTARPLQLGELRDVQQRLREGLRELREGRPWRYRLDDVEHVLVPERRDFGGEICGRFEPRWPWDSYVLTAMDLLAGVSERLRTCARPACERAFIAVKRQQYCAACKKALQKERVYAWRKRHAERVRDLAHEAYVRRRRRDTGWSRLNIERRPMTAPRRGADS